MSGLFWACYRSHIFLAIHPYFDTVEVQDWCLGKYVLNKGLDYFDMKKETATQCFVPIRPHLNYCTKFQTSQFQTTTIFKKTNRGQGEEEQKCYGRELGSPPWQRSSKSFKRIICQEFQKFGSPFNFPPTQGYNSSDAFQEKEHIHEQEKRSPKIHYDT